MREKFQISNLKFQISPGFTILELLVVFSIITVITSVGFVSYSQYSQRQIITQASGDIKATIEQAKHSALSQVRPAGCTGTLEGYKVDFLSATEYQLSARCVTESVALPVKTLPKGLTLENYAFCDGISFDTLTNNVKIEAPNTLPCQMQLANSATTQTITIDLAGNVSIQ